MNKMLIQNSLTGRSQVWVYNDGEPAEADQFVWGQDQGLAQEGLHHLFTGGKSTLEPFQQTIREKLYIIWQQGGRTCEMMIIIIAWTATNISKTALAKYLKMFATEVQ